MENSTSHLKYYVAVEKPIFLEEMPFYPVDKRWFLRKTQLLTSKAMFSRGKEHLTSKIVFYSGKLSFPTRNPFFVR